MNALGWLVLNFLSIVMLAFYSMMEMAAVSFNKVRLQYYLSKGVKQAKMLSELLKHPDKLFGTTLIGVNVATFFGSECAREFHSSLGVSPDLAPISQVVLVVIFGELAPMFAARRYSENVVMLGISLVYLSSKLMAPLLYGVGVISRLCQLVFGGKESAQEHYLNQDELKNIIIDQEVSDPSDEAVFGAVTTNIFRLKKRVGKRVMTSLKDCWMLPSNTTVEELKNSLKQQKSKGLHSDYALLYHAKKSNIIGIVFPKDLIRLSAHKKVRDSSNSPWFISESTPVLQIVRQFRSNNEEVAVLVDSQGNATGVFDLKDVLDEFFGEKESSRFDLQLKKQRVIQRQIPAEMSVLEFEKIFGYRLKEDPSLTIDELISQELGHLPEVEETVHIGPYDLTVNEVNIRGIKSVRVNTRTR